MRVMEQSDGFLPKRAPSVHEYRAALFSVFLHTGPQGAPSFALAPDMQPIPLLGAVKQIHQLPGELSKEALDVATFKLCAAVLVEHRDEFIPALAELRGVPVGDPRDFKKLYTRNVREAARADNEEVPLSYDDCRHFAYRKQAGTTQGAPPDPWAFITPPPQALIPQGVEPEAEQPLVPRPESTIDLETLVATVDISSKSNCDFAKLAETLDPRYWGPSEFWPECYQADLSPDGHEFTPHIPTAGTPSRGKSWKGYLYEHVEWNWNTQRIASFQNYLNIDYAVDEPNQKIEMRFSLFSCEGSRLYAVEFNRGIDVDSGFQTVELLPSASPGGIRFKLRTVKHIRYSDLLDRRLPNQGPPGAGQTLSYMAPAVVGLWMNELVKRLYC